jgi:Protein of unknown function (DUF3147)
VSATQRKQLTDTDSQAPTGDEEVPITARVAERPALDLHEIREARPRDLGYRFLAGAVTSIVAGLVTLAFGPRAGGIFLAFPAILAASLTLIEEQDDSAEAREDARGAVIGGCALALFAAVAALTLGKMSGAVALLLATVAWALGALLGYLAAWFR